MTIPIVVVDASVISFHIREAANKTFDADAPENLGKLLNYTELCVHWINNLEFANFGVFCASVLWAFDSKPYWRSLYQVDYKHGRSQPLASVTQVRSEIAKKVRRLAFPGFEADDVASTIYRLSRPLKRPTYFLTCDTDWMGFCDEATWLNTYLYEPRVRGRAEAIDWINNQLKKKLVRTRYGADFALSGSAKEIWRFKSLTGDSSDNIAPSDKEYSPLIDLLNPPPRFDLLRNPLVVSEIQQALGEVRAIDPGLITPRFMELGLMQPINRFFLPK